MNFGPQGGLWHDLPEFNAYVARCQSILQSGTSANDVLLYYPLHDFWNSSGPLVQTNPMPRAFSAAAMKLWDRGYAFDYLSDRFLQKAKCEDGHIALGVGKYRVILIPQCKLMPETTLAKLVELANDGALVLVEGKLPSDVPGFGNLEARRAQFNQTLGQIPIPTTSPGAAVEHIAIGKGAFLIAGDVEALLNEAAIPRESCVDLGLQFVRRAHPLGHHYFIANRGNGPVDGWITLGVAARSAVLLDPRFDDRAGIAALRKSANGMAQVYLQLQPGESCILRTFTDQAIEGERWAYLHPSGAPQTITGTWKIQFIEGGATLPKGFQTQKLASWTTLGEEPKRFAGTARYSIEFDHPSGEAADWLLDLGQVCDSAQARINDHAAGGFWCAPFKINVGRWLVPGKNKLEVEVTNLAINRIADMDRRHENWKYFYDANVATHLGRGVFDASKLPPRDSGLLGPVQLVPLAKTEVATQSR